MSNSGEHKHEHHTAEDLSAKLESSAKLRGWIIRGTIGFLILVFLGGMVWMSNDLLSYEGQLFPPRELDETITNPPDGADGIYAYLQGAIETALEQRPKLSMNTNFDLHGDSIAFTGDSAKAERLKATLQMVAPDVVGQFRDALAQDETQYGDDFSDLLWPIAAATEAVCEFKYYRCAGCGHESGEPLPECPDCDMDEPHAEQYRWEYTLMLRFEDGSPEIDALFHSRTPEEITALLGDQLDGYAAISSIETTYRNARIVAVVGRGSNKLLSLQFKKDIDVTMGLRVDPALEDIDTTLTCTLSESTDFSFTWPAVYLSTRGMTLGKRASSQLTARFDAPLEHETPHTWRSSDPAICSVDKDGYLKTGREFGEAVITVSFELDGVTYTDECKVQVKVPVEKATLNRRSLKLAPGETKQLNAKISPKKATYKDVTWHTEDEAIAAVDENGLVTAISPGKTTVYAVTVEGYYKASCVITVGGDR